MSGSLPAPEVGARRTPSPAGWYPDPTRGGAGWRWWDGNAWTTFTERTVGPSAARRPRLPRWLSVPVVVCVPLVALSLAVLTFTNLTAVVAGLVPLAIVLPTIAWLDRVEPEPRASRAHALLWGASVAVVVALIVNSIVGLVAGEVVATVLSAPLIEEATKAAGIVWAVRRAEVDGVSDGVVYAAWVAIGFAAVEDMSYFAVASIEGSLGAVFVVRALLTPFAHPLFTFWSGLAIGRAVRAGRPLGSAWWGVALAVAGHALWNGALSLGSVTTDIDEDVAVGVVVAAGALFVVLFVAVAAALAKMRRGERDRFLAVVPELARRHGLAPHEIAAFSSWQGLLAARRALPKPHRPRFDALHAALARLALLEQHPTAFDPTRAVVLAEQLAAARARLAAGRGG